MFYIISGSNRPNSRSLQVSQLVAQMYQNLGTDIEIINLNELSMDQLTQGTYTNAPLPGNFRALIDKVDSAEGLVIVVPEYNGSMPGALKLFIDHWSYPKSFEFRPVCFIGLGGRFGGLRPVEHLQQVFGYRNGFSYPERVFITNVWDILKDGKLADSKILDLLKSQAIGFKRFVKALQDSGLHTNHRITNSL